MTTAEEEEVEKTAKNMRNLPQDKININVILYQLKNIYMDNVLIPKQKIKPDIL